MPVSLNLPDEVTFETALVADIVCPNCHSQGLSLFYGVKDIPVHSCLLMDTRGKALNYPRSDLRLGFCAACGFVSNTLFEERFNEYSTSYEETQGFSECFNAFAKSLARRVIDNYNIHNKTILEIGCGKGEFLALMCQLGENKGIGIDPAYVPQRHPDPSIRIEFIQDLYSEKYAHIQADVVCCRHTLEHIAATSDFMKTLRETIGDRKDTLVFFELPDVMRVLQEGAFWDIYYEHCTYFTAGSLARLFRSCGFDIDDLYLDYDDQYLIITAWPSDEPALSTHDLENDLDETMEAFENFEQKCAAVISQWRQRAEDWQAKNERAVVWGGGSKGVAFLTTLKLGDAIEYVVDINPYKHNKYMPGSGQKVVSPEHLKDYQPQHVIVMNPVYCDEIQRDLDLLGVKADLWAV